MTVFVSCERIGTYEWKSTITEEGRKELDKYGWEEGEQRNLIFPDGRYSADKPPFCMICGSKKIANTVSWGMFPRFAACEKHEAFLGLTRDLIRKEKE